MNHPSPLHREADARLPAAAYLRYESRADGWSPGRQAAFLAHLADHGVVEDAARCVGMSQGGGYALRRTARGYAFNLGWEAALIIARRVISDRLMTAAIRGEEARWVREDGVTTYTRQNTRLSLALLDRINPATTLAEVMAVAARFDWFVQLLEEGASGEALWDFFFNDALPHSEPAARARVRASLLLSEESAGFDEEDEEYAEEDPDERPIEYKSMDGPPRNGSQSCAMSCLSASDFDWFAQRTNEPTTQVCVESSWPVADLSDFSLIESPASRGPSLGRWVRFNSPFGKMPALHQCRDHAGGDHQNAAIIKRPDGKANPACLGQGPCPREDQQVGCDKGHGAKADAIARKIAVPRHRRHPGNKQRINRRLDSERPVARKEIGDIGGEHENGDRQQFLAQNRMHPPVAQKQHDGNDMTDGKGNRAPDHVDLQQAIAQRPEGHHSRK